MQYGAVKDTVDFAGVKNMQRIIKFRGWDKRENQMFLFENPFIDEEYNRLSLSCDWEKYDLTHGGLQIENKDLILMQYTGLKDKNGKEIYEDDLITWGGGGVHWVEWRDTSWAFKNESWLFSMITQEERDSIEIIGTIYENPELLK